MRKIKKYILLVFTCGMLLVQISFAQLKQYRFEEIDSLQKIAIRPVVVFLHTSWCKYCGTMKNITLKNDEVIQALNQKYYFVNLNIEEKKDIVFRGHTYRYQPTGVNIGVNELADQLGTINGQLAYPGICLLNAGYEIIYQKEGYISAKQLLSILKNLE